MTTALDPMRLVHDDQLSPALREYLARYAETHIAGTFAADDDEVVAS